MATIEATAGGPTDLTGRSGQTVDPGIAGVLTRLGVALQRYRIYPPLSPLCRESSDAAHAALEEWVTAAAEQRSDGEAIEIRVQVASSSLYVDLGLVPETGPIGELAERLYRADIDELVVRGDATKTELARFCRRLAGWEHRQDRDLSFSQVLTELDVSGVRARDSKRLDILDHDIMSGSRLAAVREERARRGDGDQGYIDASTHKAWVRVELDSSLETIDMVDLAFLVEDQMDLANMLSQIAQPRESGTGGAALRHTVSQLAHLYADLSPEVAEARFAELAASLMELEPAARRALTRDVILTDVLETGKSSSLMRHLPDEEIVEAIRTLTDLEIGGQGLVRLAFQRLDLPDDRLSNVLKPLLGDLKDVKHSPGGQPQVHLALERDVFADMREFAAQQLSVDAETADELVEIRTALSLVDGAAERLRCAVSLIPHLRNPDRAAEILKPVPQWLETLLEADPVEAGLQIRVLRETAGDLDVFDPELARAIHQVLREILTPDSVRKRVRDWADTEGGSESLGEMLEAFGPVAAEAFLLTLEEEEDRAVRRLVLDFMCAHAAQFADFLIPHATAAEWTIVRNVVRVLGFAGPGQEATVAKTLANADRRVVREALMALSRIGTPRASEEILGQLASDDERRALAEDAVRRFPAAEGVSLTRRLLSDSNLYLDRPQVARTLITSFLSDGGDETLLRPLLKLRLRFWNPGLLRLGWTASAALRSGR